MKYILILIIRAYQKTLSPDHGLFKARWPYGFCRYSPSCSEYAMEAIKTYGAVKGTYLTGKRILRCNPFAQPGADPVPKL